MCESNESLWRKKYLVVSARSGDMVRDDIDDGIVSSSKGNAKGFAKLYATCATRWVHQQIFPFHILFLYCMLRLKLNETD